MTIYGVAILMSLSVAFAFWAAAEWWVGRGDQVLRRLRAEQKASLVGGGSRPSLRIRVVNFLERMGDWMSKGREGEAGYRALLAQAGYPSRRAATIYQASRLVLILGSVGFGFFILQLMGLSFLVLLMTVPYFAILGWMAPRVWLRVKVAEQKKLLMRSLADTLDLLVVCIEAGLGLNQAVVRIAKEMEQMSPEMARELRTLNLEIQAGTPRDEAFRNLGRRTGLDDLQALATMLIQADRFGTSIGDALRIFADELRDKRKQRAQEAAAKTAVKLIIPLAIFVFPALFIVVMGPAAISIVRAFSTFG